MIDYERLRQDLEMDEGRKSRPYRDSVGKLTIGIGRNLEDKGLSNPEIDILFRHDVADAEADCRNAFGWFDALNSVRQGVLVQLCFNLGLTKLRKFEKMIAALHQQDFVRASDELKDSQWAHQVQPSRSSRLIRELRSGTF